MRYSCMIKVFIGGSRRISHLPQAVTIRLDTIISSDFTVLVGDADGVDLLIQKYLFAKNYSNVLVFCTGATCRNNAGKWEIRNVPATLPNKGFQFYAIKDLAMAGEADYGFMIWDGKSKGTLNNVLNLLQANKKTLLYFAPTQSYFSIRTIDDLSQLLNHCTRQNIEIFEQELPLFKIYSKQQTRQMSVESSISQMNLGFDNAVEVETSLSNSRSEAVLV